VDRNRNIAVNMMGPEDVKRTMKSQSKEFLDERTEREVEKLFNKITSLDFSNKCTQGQRCGQFHEQ